MSERPWNIGRRGWTLKRHIELLRSHGIAKVYRMRIPNTLDWPSYRGLMEESNCASAAVAEQMRLGQPESEDSKTIAAQVLKHRESWMATAEGWPTGKLIGIRCSLSGHMGPETTSRIGLKLLAFGLPKEEFAEIVESLLALVNKDGSVRCEPSSAGDASRRIPTGLVLIFLAEYRMHYQWEGGDQKDPVEAAVEKIGTHLLRSREVSNPAGWKISRNEESVPDLCSTAICLEAVLLSGVIARKDAAPILGSVFNRLRQARRSSSRTATETVGDPSTTLYYNTYYHLARMICTAMDLGYCRQTEGRRALRSIARRLYSEYCSTRSADRMALSCPPDGNWITKPAQDMATLTIISMALWAGRSDDRYRAWRYSKWSPSPDAAASHGHRVAKCLRWARANIMGLIGFTMIGIGMALGFMFNAFYSALTLVGAFVALIPLFHKTPPDENR